MVRYGPGIGIDCQRTPDRIQGVIDAGLCHGAAGIGHVFNRLFQTAGENAACGRCAAVVQHRIGDAGTRCRANPSSSIQLHGKTMQMPPSGIAGFSAWTYTEALGWQWIADRGFLTGAAGIGLALTAALAPTWDRVLLLSSRESSKARDHARDR
jgi:lantibiotic biosynthesis protein